VPKWEECCAWRTDHRRGAAGHKAMNAAEWQTAPYTRQPAKRSIKAPWRSFWSLADHSACIARRLKKVPEAEPCEAETREQQIREDV
jgi:hypothetical protein